MFDEEHEVMRNKWKKLNVKYSGGWIASWPTIHASVCSSYWSKNMKRRDRLLLTDFCIPILESGVAAANADTCNGRNNIAEMLLRIYTLQAHNRGRRITRP